MLFISTIFSSLKVTGASGAGKSSVVNALRSLRDSDKGAARTGITETTLTPEMYEWRLGYSSGGTSSSERGSLVTQEAEAIICDLPGIGTPRFPQASYLKSMGIRYFDLVLLITASRLTESELRLVAELKAYGVPHFLVRNKIDVDIEAELLNEEDEVEDPLEEQQLRHQVAKQTMDIVKQDLRALTGAKHVYCISTRRRCRRRHDFPKLVDDIKRAVAKHVPERPRELAVTVCGAPKTWAMKFLEETESSARCWYGASAADSVMDSSRHLSCGIYDLFLIMGHAGFCSTPPLNLLEIARIGVGTLAGGSGKEQEKGQEVEEEEEEGEEQEEAEAEAEEAEEEAEAEAEEEEEEVESTRQRSPRRRGDNERRKKARGKKWI
eukprot:s186_g10.t1